MTRYNSMHRKEDNKQKEKKEDRNIGRIKE